MQGTQQATIGRIMRGKGFGFINLPGGEQLFFHTTQVQNCSDLSKLRVGDLVEFKIGNDQNNKKEAKEVFVKADISNRQPMLDWADDPKTKPGSYRPQRQSNSYANAYDPYAAGGYGHEQHYGPPQQHYGPPQQNYGAPQQNYGAPQQNYGHYGPPQHYAPSEPIEGTVARLKSSFGFISSFGTDYFFPATNVLHNKFEELKAGDKIIFVPGPDPRGRTEMIATEIRKGTGEGVIDKLANGFGFLVADDGERLFFHGRHLQSAEFDSLKEGMRLAFSVKPSRNRPNTFEAQEISVLA